MKKIHKLDPSVISKIAAGEVVERPASIIKELVENSIDAGAKEINIKILEGGIDLIEIQDDGIGVSEEDIEGMVSHHATSKMKELEDLYTIFTFGFRGEALSSIASVSNLSIWSKTKDENGFDAEVSEGKIIRITPKPRNQTGTTIKVEGLFKNIPARKKFLKSVRTETTHIYKVYEDFALAYPNISFTLESNGVQTKKLSPQSPQERVASVWPKSVADHLIPIEYNGKDIQVKGFIIHPYASFSRPKNTKIYVQNRPIHSNLIHKAVIDGYDTMLEVRKYPAYILKITLDPQSVDVNVHPRKMEVKFDDERFIYKTIRSLVSASLQKKYIDQMSSTRENVSPSIEIEQNQSPSFERKQERFMKGIVQKSFVNEGLSLGYQVKNHQKSKEYLQKEFTSPAQSFSHEQDKGKDKKIVAIHQILNLYLIIVYQDQIEIIDQHAAHEKILLEKFLNNHEVHSQSLITPIPLDLQDEYKELFFERAHELKGFEFRDFGNNTILLDAIPTFIQQKSKSLFQEIIDTIIHDQDGFYTKDFTVNFYKNVACKAAVKAGDPLQLDEINQFLIDLRKSDKAYACCHGRPTTRVFTQKELDKLFSR
jgi:DNA mismatch repair protein MutL